MIHSSHHQLISSHITELNSPQNNWFIIGFINQHNEAFLIAVYIANIIVTAIVGSICLFATSKAPQFVFQQVYQANDSMKIIGSFWIAIGIVSLMGIFNPIKFSPILVIQIIYKAIYLIVEVIPRLARKDQIPMGIASSFLAWVILLSFIVPWKYLFSK